MKKILLVVGYKTINYGSVLQAYATQKMFEKAGATVEILNMESLWRSTRKKKVMFYLKNAEIVELINRKGGIYLYINQMIISKNPQFTGKIRGLQAEFTTNLLLYGKALICC